MLPVEDRDCVLPAPVDGAARYPELRSLLPGRGAEAVDCPCRAHPLFASGKVLCSQCGGLGRLPRPDICLPDGIPSCPSNEREKMDQGRIPKSRGDAYPTDAGGG